MKKNILIVTLVLCLVSIFTFFIQNQSKVKTEEEANIILNKIEEVNKLILVEGSFAEVYTYKQATRLFYNLFPVEKKVIVIVEAKASVGYDLSKVKYEIDKEHKKIVIKSIPTEEIIIEPKVRYYDIQQSQFYKLDANDLTKINAKAIELIKTKVKASSIPGTAEDRLAEVLENIIFTSENLGWEVINEQAQILD